MVSNERANPAISAGTNFLNVFLVVAALYFARDLFMPLAMAVLFSFMLSPVVNVLQGWRLGRVPSAFIAVLFAFALLGLIGTFVAGQLGDVAKKIPEYQENIHKKLEPLRSSGGALNKLLNSVEQLRQEVTPLTTNAPPPTAPGQRNEKPVPVEVRNASFSTAHIVSAIFKFHFLNLLFTPFTGSYGCLCSSGARICANASSGCSAMTRRTPRNASWMKRQNASAGYLLMQFIVNVSYGIPIALGLFFIGIPNPILWGALAALMRYIPYVGIWIAMCMPIALGLAVDPEWTKPLAALGLFAVVEIIVANVIEPLLYGSAAGISPLAVLVAAVFWTWLWGPVGLVAFDAADGVPDFPSADICRDLALSSSCWAMKRHPSPPGGN